MNDWKKRLGVVFSTNPDFNYQTEEEQQPDTLAPEKQKLRVAIEKKGRAGKTVTVVKGFTGSEEDLKNLEKMLKTKCGTGGSSKDGVIILQGEMKDKLVTILRDLGYTATK
ncbi:MAG: translation initiation factor [Bacteroidaceae bacterium]|jgi:translation initiation factor 1|nr:translation initiation factor [Bacteroidaceae bacterium]